jgi:acyl dehydratase
MTIAVGDALAPFIIDAVSPAAMHEWAVFLHDPNPIHLDADVVRARGLGDRVINQGPANVAYLINMLHAAFPGATLAAIESRFIDNVYGGERVVAAGEIAEIDADRVTCALTLTAGDDRIVLTGTATMILSILTKETPNA